MPQPKDKTKSLLFFIPPSAIIGILNFSAIAPHSNTAENCGTPKPVTILVAQALPPPTPTFTASAPALTQIMKSNWCADITMITSFSELCFNSLIKFNILSECP